MSAFSGDSYDLESPGKLYTLPDHETKSFCTLWRIYLVAPDMLSRISNFYQRKLDKQIKPQISAIGQCIWRPLTQIAVSLKVLRDNKQCLNFFVGENFVSDEWNPWNGSPTLDFQSIDQSQINAVRH